MIEEKKDQTSEMIKCLLQLYGLWSPRLDLPCSLQAWSHPWRSASWVLSSPRVAPLDGSARFYPSRSMNLIPVRPIGQQAQPVKVSPRSVTLLRAGEAGHRVHIPARIHPYTSGIKGGIAGGIAMAFVACVYGIIAYGSVWYPINLLAAAALPSMANADLSRLKAFDPPALVLAILIHGVISILVGLLFAVLLPMLPSRRHAFLGSLFTPLLWSALVWSTLGSGQPDPQRPD